MAKWKSNPNLEKYVDQLEKLRDEGREYIGLAIYSGAAVVADEMRREIMTLKVAQDYVPYKENRKISTITSVQKRGLLDGFGIAKMRKDGDFYNVKLGFAGYNGQYTDQWPHGVPNIIIARSIVSGTYFRTKNDFVSRVIKRSKNHAESVMERKFEEALEKFMW